jgi:hypothetical protein
MKFHCSKTNTFCLAAVHVKVNLLHFLSQWSGKEHVRKNLKKDDKRAAVELWRVKVPFSTVRNHLKVFARTLRRVLASKEPIPSTRTSSGNLCQEGWGKSACPPGFRKSLFKRGEWPDTSTVYGLYTYQSTLDTFDTVYSSFHWICVWPAKTFDGDCSCSVQADLPQNFLTDNSTCRSLKLILKRSALSPLSAHPQPFLSPPLSNPHVTLTLFPW